APVARGAVEAVVTLEGRLVPPPDRDATLAPLVAGRIESVAVREGETVARGATLALVDRRAVDEGLAAARAAREAARREEAAKEAVAATTRALFEKGIASKEERDADGAAAEAARASRLEVDGKLAQAERQASYATLAAPFDGVVAQVLRHAGELVDGTPSTPVVRVVGTERPEIAAPAAASDLARLSAGQAAAVTFPGARPVPARVARVPRVVDATTSLADVRLRLEAASAAPLLSGAKVAIVVERKEGILVAPPRALRRSESGAVEAVVVEKGICRVRAVTTGLVSANAVEILSGLSEGESLVVDSPLGLTEGAVVDVKPGAG
ncbi:MAG TPA: efflux RND transporter periplasmic adaptor subunit, partial [Thermoanaerobaculia bacterium]|nr:efflux RND transporter periplasmic adaptor subunit [Thermoanaerobaculia bacterium]